jgi:hypothetical protein
MQNRSKNLNLRPETLKLLQENKGKTLENIGTVNDFLNKTLITQELRIRIYKWDCIKLKSFCIAKETITRIKRH